MTSIQNFTLWFLDKLPDFLMSEPIIYFVGLMLFGVLITCIRRLFNLT